MRRFSARIGIALTAFVLGLVAALAAAAETNVGLLATGGTASCQGCNLGSYNGAPYCHDAAVLFDGLLDRRAGCTFTGNIVRAWPQAMSMSAVRFYSYGDMGWPPRYAVYASTDGATWMLLAQGVALQNQWTSVSFSPVLARYLRLHLWSTDNWIYSHEVQVFGGPSCTVAGCASVEAAVGEELALELSAAAVSFGRVVPSQSPQTVPGAVAFTVRSNVPWHVFTSAQPLRLAGSGTELPATEYREGISEFKPFPAQPSLIASGLPTAGETHIHDYRQHVPFTAPPGRYAGTVMYEALAR